MSARMSLVVTDIAGTRQGDGPVLSVSAFSLKSKLDGLSTVSITVSATEERAIDQLTVRRIVTVYLDPLTDEAITFAYGPFLILKRQVKDGPGGASLVLTCTDKAALLRERTTLFGRKYKSSTLTAAVADLQTLVTDLSITLSVEAGYGSKAISMRFDAATVWEALVALANVHGLHIKITGSTVTIGAFGTVVTDNMFMNVDNMNNSDLVSRTSPPFLIIDSISKEDNVEEMCNWILPIGAGSNQQALKLRASTRVTPYTIQNATGPNGKLYYYLSDPTSIAAYGEIRKVVQWPDIVPASNTATDKIEAANQLYDAAVGYLQRMKDPQSQYTLSVRTPRGGGFSIPNIGFKYRTVYRGNVVDKAGVNVDYIDVDTNFWVLGVTTRINLEGYSLDVDISTSDIVPETSAGKIVSSISQNNMRGRTVSVVPNVRSWYWERDFSSALTAVSFIEITDATVDIERVTVRIRYSALRQGLTTGVTDSATTPTGMRITINGTDRTVALGGPWTGTGNALLDITNYIVNDPGGLYQVHTISFSCTSGNGRITNYYEIVETVSGVEVT